MSTKRPAPKAPAAKPSSGPLATPRAQTILFSAPENGTARVLRLWGHASAEVLLRTARRAGFALPAEAHRYMLDTTGAAKHEFLGIEMIGEEPGLVR
jgi:hypothetical protein